MIRSISASMVLGAAVALWGCDREEVTVEPAPEAPPAQQVTPAPPAGTGTPAQPAQPPAGPRETAPPPTPGAAPEETPATPPRQEERSSVEPTPPPPQRTVTQPPAVRQQTAPPTPAAAAATPEAKARALIEQLQAQKGQGQWAEGEKTLRELETLKRSVPRDLREEIDNERSSFRAAKAIWGQDR